MQLFPEVLFVVRAKIWQIEERIMVFVWPFGHLSQANKHAVFGFKPEPKCISRTVVIIIIIIIIIIVVVVVALCRSNTCLKTQK